MGKEIKKSAQNLGERRKPAKAGFVIADPVGSPRELLFRCSGPRSFSELAAL